MLLVRKQLACSTLCTTSTWTNYAIITGHSHICLTDFRSNRATGGSFMFHTYHYQYKTFLFLRGKQAGRDWLHYGMNWNTKYYKMLRWWP